MGYGIKTVTSSSENILSFYQTIFFFIFLSPTTLRNMQEISKSNNPELYLTDLVYYVIIYRKHHKWHIKLYFHDTFFGLFGIEMANH